MMALNVNERRVLGDVPTITPDNPTHDQIVATYRYYNYMYGPDDGKPWIISFMKKSGYAEKDIEQVSGLPMWNFTHPFFTIAKLVNDGVNLPPEKIAFLKQRLALLIEKSTPEPKPAVEKIPTKPIGTSKFIEDIDGQIDDFIEDEYPASYEFRCPRISNGEIQTILVEKYEQIRDEIASALHKQDFQCVEGGTKLQNYHKFISEICNRIAGIDVVAEAPVVKKRGRPAGSKNKVKLTMTKKASKNLLVNFKYQKNSGEYHVNSIDPQSIVGSSALLIYNTKYKFIGIYVAEDGKTLDIKPRTSMIMNYDVNKSYIKRGVKGFDDFMKGTMKMVQNKIASLKNSPAKITSSLSEDYLLLRTFKS